MARGTRSPAEAVEALIPFIYDAATARERIDEDLAMRRDWFPKPEAYMAQLQGILSWEAYSRLDQISAPTLVIHGLSDRLIPAGNGKVIADRTPSAQHPPAPRARPILST